MGDVRVIEVKQSVFADNDRKADELRATLRERGTFLLNLMSSPGSGKTTTLSRTIEALKDEIRRRVRHPLPAEDLHFLLSQGSQTAGVLGGGMMVLGYLRRGEPFRL